MEVQKCNKIHKNVNVMRDKMSYVISICNDQFKKNKNKQTNQKDFTNYLRTSHMEKQIRWHYLKQQFKRLDKLFVFVCRHKRHRERDHETVLHFLKNHLIHTCVRPLDILREFPQGLDLWLHRRNCTWEIDRELMRSHSAGLKKKKTY